VAVGYLPDPLAQTAEVTRIALNRLAVDGGDNAALRFDLNIALLEGSGWTEAEVPALINQVNAVLAQCGIRLSSVEIVTLRVPDRLLDFDAATAQTLINQSPLSKPAVVLVRDTLRRPAFEGEAFGRANTFHRPWLRDTIWLTYGISDPQVGLAHELFHVLGNSGEHVDEPGNLMQTRTDPAATALNETQCERARNSGLANNLLKKS